MNRKGDVQSIIYAGIAIVVTGIILVFMSHLFYNIYGTVETTFLTNPSLNYSNATNAISNIKAVEQNVWDYGFLAILVAYILAVGLFSFFQRTSPFFFWLSLLLSIIGMFAGVVLATLWQGLSEQEVMAETMARFPITNVLLGSYYPMIVLFIIVIGLVFLYGKNSESDIR